MKDKKRAQEFCARKRAEKKARSTPASDDSSVGGTSTDSSQPRLTKQDLCDTIQRLREEIGDLQMKEAQRSQQLPSAPVQSPTVQPNYTEARLKLVEERLAKREEKDAHDVIEKYLLTLIARHRHKGVTNQEALPLIDDYLNLLSTLVWIIVERHPDRPLCALLQRLKTVMPAMHVISEKLEAMAMDFEFGCGTEYATIRSMTNNDRADISASDSRKTLVTKWFLPRGEKRSRSEGRGGGSRGGGRGGKG